MELIKCSLQKCIGYLLALSVFFLPIRAQVATIFIVLAFLASLPYADWKNIRFNLLRNRFFLFSILFFVLHLIGLSYSENLSYGFKDLQTKLSFLIFPLLFAFYRPLSEDIILIKKSFIAGCIAALLICLVRALIDYSTSSSTDVFFYETFSKMLHPTYFSFYLNLALIFLIDDAYSNHSFKRITTTSSFFIVEMFLLIGIVMLSARMSIITTAFSLIVFIGLKYWQNKEAKLFSVSLILSVLIAACIQFGLASRNNRFAQIEAVVQNNMHIPLKTVNDSIKVPDYNSATSRLAIWKHSAQLIVSTPQNLIIGVGTGDIKDKLMKVYAAKGFQKGVTKNYNPHNQFLHTTVSLGLIGLTVLLLILLLPLLHAFKQKKFVLAMFLIIILFNGLTESVLEVQSGIIFLSFFYCLLLTEFDFNKVVSKN